MKKNLIRNLVATALAAAGATLALAGPAQAYPSDCTSSAYICFYDNTNGTGLLVQSSATGGYVKSICYTATSLEQRASYIANPTSHNFIVYLNTSCSGTSAPIYAHSTGAMNSTWNNKIRSIVRVD